MGLCEVSPIQSQHGASSYCREVNKLIVRKFLIRLPRLYRSQDIMPGSAQLKHGRKRKVFVGIESSQSTLGLFVGDRVVDLRRVRAIIIPGSSHIQSG